MTNITRAEIEKLIEPYLDGTVPYGIMLKHPNIITHLLTQIDALREALKPLANIADAYPDIPLLEVLWCGRASNGKEFCVLTVSLALIAAEALAQTEHLA
jgi:hypothetical protein